MELYNFLCGGIKAPKNLKGTTSLLNVQGGDDVKNVTLKVDSISSAVMGNIPDRLLDLLEIGAYVYCADQQTKRGTEQLTDYGIDWRRDMNFIVPVRLPDLWNSAEIKTTLEETLEFLSGEPYKFTFVQATQPVKQLTQYFEFINDPLVPDEVALFSGGVDSLAGAIERIVGENKHLALVGHYSSSKVKHVQTALVDELKAKGHAGNLQYISIEARNSGSPAKEYTQRTRSFLFACLAMAIAHMYGKDRFSFYENGVVSLNLPLTKDILESRATRTTHPAVINGLTRLFSLVFEKDIIIDHPYQWLTKTEVTKKIGEYDCHALLDKSNSCTRPHIWSREKNHCGACSQCIDRRFSILAADMGAYDNASKYKIDLLTGERGRNDEIVMAASYAKFAQQFSNFSKDQFITEHPQISLALSEFEGMSTQEVEDKAYDLFQRHCADVLRVIDQGFSDNKDKLLKGNLPATSILATFFNRTKIQPMPISGYDQQLEENLKKLGEQKCYFHFDEAGSKIVFNGGYVIDGAGFTLVKELLPNFRAGKASDPTQSPFYHSKKLAQVLNIEEDSLRKRINRLRDEATEHLATEQGIVFDTGGFIENSPTHGYRLNPRLIEVAALSDLTS